MNIQIVLVGSESWSSSLRRCWRFLRFRQGRKKHNNALTIELELRRGICFMVLAAVSMYLLGGLGLYMWRARMPYNQITYWDILQAPVNMQGVFKKLGRAQILQAREDLKNGQVMDSFFKYRSGIKRMPEDQRARLELAQFFIGAGMNVEATDLLTEGLQYGIPEDPAYINTLLLLTQYTENNPALLRSLPIILDYPEVANNKDSRVAMKQLLLRAQVVERDYAGVIETAQQLNQENTGQSFYEYALFAFLRMGSYEDAADYYEKLPEVVAADPNMLLLKGYLMQVQGDGTGARKIYYSLFRDYPGAWKAQMDSIMLLYGEGDEGAADSLLDLYLAINRRNGSALTAIASQFTDLPDSVKVMQVLNSVRFDAPELLGSMWFYYIQALVTEGKFEKAKVEIDQISPAAPKDPDAASVFEAYKCIINAATARSAGEYTTLVKYFETNRLSVELYWEAGEAMRKIGAYSQAELILNAGLTAYPFSRMLSDLRTAVLKEKSTSDRQTREAVASVNSEGYQNQRIKGDPLEGRLVGENMQPGTLESLVGDEKLKNIELTDEDLRKSDK